MIKWVLSTSLLFALCGLDAQAQILNAASCSSSAVQSAINSASTGSTVNVPAGSCSWAASSVSISKAITLSGAGRGATIINVGGGNPAFTITKQTAGVIRVPGFTFSASNNNNLPHPIVVTGSWPGGQPVIFENNAFILSAATMVDVAVAGGVIFANNTFTGGQNDFLLTVK